MKNKQHLGSVFVFMLRLHLFLFVFMIFFIVFEI